MEHDDIIFLGKCHQLMIKGLRCHGSRRIIRIRNQHELGFLRHFLRNVLQLDNIIIFLFLRHVIQLRPGQPRPISKNRIARVRHQHHITGIQYGQCYMGKPVLRAKQGTDFRVCVQCYTVTPLIPLCHSLQHLLCIIDGIDVVFRLHDGLRHDLHNPFGRGNIGRTNAQVKDLFSLCHTASPHFSQPGKNSFPELLHSLCKFHRLTFLQTEKGRLDIAP